MSDMYTGASTLRAIVVESPAGRVVVDAADIVTFPHGLPGFESCRRFALVAPPDIAPFAWLLGLDAPAPSFLVVDPRLVVAGYAVPLAAAERARLGTDESIPCLWLAIVRVDGETPSANLAAPIVVNPARMLGLQVLPSQTAYGTAHAISGAAA